MNFALNDMFRVSSVLNSDKKQFGKSHMFDAKEDTCWNSDEVWLVELCYRIIVICMPLYS